MIKKLLGAAAMAAIAYAVVPASAAKMAGCSSENLAKAESSIGGARHGLHRAILHADRLVLAFDRTRVRVARADRSAAR